MKNALYAFAIIIVGAVIFWGGAVYASGQNEPAAANYQYDGAMMDEGYGRYNSDMMGSGSSLMDGFSGMMGGGFGMGGGMMGGSSGMGGGMMGGNGYNSPNGDMMGGAGTWNNAPDTMPNYGR